MPQTVCGSFTAPQVGQSERAGASSVQFDARRLRVFAPGGLALGDGHRMLLGIGGSVVEGERAQRVPPRIGRVRVAVAVGLRCGRCRTSGTARRNPRGTAARRADRADGVADRQLEVDLLALERVGLALDRRRARRARGPGSRSRGRTGRQAAAALALVLARTVPWTTMPSLMRSSHSVDARAAAADRRDPPTPPSSLPGISMRTARRAAGWCSRSETLQRSAVMCVGIRLGGAGHLLGSSCRTDAGYWVGDLPTAGS